MDNSKCNQGVECSVKSCRFHDRNNKCRLDRIVVTSDMNEKHYCESFEESSDAPEL
jgi:hypothetical protein